MGRSHWQAEPVEVAGVTTDGAWQVARPRPRFSPGLRPRRKRSSQAEVSTRGSRLLGRQVRCGCLWGSHTWALVCFPRDKVHGFLEILEGVCDPSKIQCAGPLGSSGALPLQIPWPQCRGSDVLVMRHKEDKASSRGK